MRSTALLLLIASACSNASPPTAVIDVVDAASASPLVAIARPEAVVREGSGVAIGKLGTRDVVFVSDEDGGAVRAIDLDDGHEIGATTVAKPGPLVVLRSGSLAVAARDDASIVMIAAHDDGTLTRAGRIATSREPTALALSPDDATLYVATGVSHTLTAFRLDDHDGAAPVFAMDVEHEPRGIAVSRDGARLFVSHAAAGVVEVVDVATHAVTKRELGDPSDFVASRHAYALSRANDWLLVPHANMMTGDPSRASKGYGDGERCGVESPAQSFQFSIITDAGQKKHVVVQAPDVTSRKGCHLPRGAVTVGETTYVACFGSDAIEAFSVREVTRELITKRVDPKPVFGTWIEVERRGRASLTGGPSAVAFDGAHERLVAFSPFEGTLSIVPLTGFGANVRTIALGRATHIDATVARGRKLFFTGGDARIAKDGRACASCHVEGRDDGLVWSTPDGARRTLMLAGRANRSGPFGWLGNHTTLEDHVHATIKNLDGAGLDDGDMHALTTFVRTLALPRQEWRALTTEEARGRDVFASGDAQCASCHGDKTNFSDHDTHDVKSGRAFLVPSLAGVSATGPYFHDGRYRSLEDLIDRNKTMGSTQHLSEEDRRALAAYLRVL